MLRIQVARRCGRISSHRGDRCAQRVLARHRDVSPSQADLGNQPQPSQHIPVGWERDSAESNRRCWPCQAQLGNPMVCRPKHGTFVRPSIHIPKSSRLRSGSQPSQSCHAAFFLNPALTFLPCPLGNLPQRSRPVGIPIRRTDTNLLVLPSVLRFVLRLSPHE